MNENRISREAQVYPGKEKDFAFPSESYGLQFFEIVLSLPKLAPKLHILQGLRLGGIRCRIYTYLGNLDLLRLRLFLAGPRHVTSVRLVCLNWKYPVVN